MHRLFTSTHTFAVLIFVSIVLVLLAKAMKTDISRLFSQAVFIKLLFISLMITAFSAFYQYPFASGMNQVTVFGFPRGFYEIIYEPTGFVHKSIKYRYFLEDLSIWMGLCSILWLFFKFLALKTMK
jgi:hypothetical protein